MLEPRLPSLALLLLETDTEAEVAVAGTGVEVDAASRTQVRTAIDPRAAPMDTGGARSADIKRIGLGTRCVTCVSIRCPLPHIAMHIKKAPGIGNVLAYIFRLSNVVIIICISGSD